ncbi:hypothetical protein ABZP36_035630 [Zizania latifolia]
MALAILVWEAVSFFVLRTLQANGLEDLFRKFVAIFGSGYLLIAVVVSREDLHGFRAIERACELVSLKLKEISVIGAMILFTREALEHVYTIAAVLSQRDRPEEERTAPDTAAEILRFSLGAALLQAIMSSFVCSVILALYCESNRRNTVFTNYTLIIGV